MDKNTPSYIAGNNLGYCNTDPEFTIGGQPALTTKQAAAYLHLSEAAIRQHLQAGHIAAQRSGRDNHYTTKSLDALRVSGHIHNPAPRS